jgi:hypothetical protein
LNGIVFHPDPTGMEVEEGDGDGPHGKLTIGLSIPLNALKGGFKKIMKGIKKIFTVSVESGNKSGEFSMTVEDKKVKEVGGAFETEKEPEEGNESDAVKKSVEVKYDGTEVEGSVKAESANINMDLSKSQSKSSQDNAPKKEAEKPEEFEMEIPKEQKNESDGKFPVRKSQANLPKTEAEFKQKFLNLKIE